MAIEEYSRGINNIVMNDININALNVCKKNCSSLGINDVVFTHYDYANFKNNINQKFDLIILDPPYKMNNVSEILLSIIPLLKKNGRIVFEMANETEYPEEIEGLKAIKDKKYGIKKVIVYR